MVMVKKNEVSLHTMLKIDTDAESVRSFWLMRCFLSS